MLHCLYQQYIEELRKAAVVLTSMLLGCTELELSPMFSSTCCSWRLIISTLCVRVSGRGGGSEYYRTSLHRGMINMDVVEVYLAQYREKQKPRKGLTHI